MIMYDRFRPVRAAHHKYLSYEIRGDLKTVAAEKFTVKLHSLTFVGRSIAFSKNTVKPPNITPFFATYIDEGL